MKPRPLFRRTGKLNEAVRRKLASCSTVILILDFDGTLAPIRKTPSLAAMPQKTTSLLARLARRTDFTVGLATGRSRTDILGKVGLRDLFLISNHGFEISLGKKRWVHPAAKLARPQLTECARSLRRSFRDVRGVLIEHKGYTLSVHYRNVSRFLVPLVKETAQDLLRRYHKSLRATSGKKVLEIRPRVLWGKGHAALRILKSLRRSPTPLVLYVGDDVTDEDAFRRLPRSAVTVVVGRHATAASYSVKNPGDVARFLQAMNSIKTKDDDQ